MSDPHVLGEGLAPTPFTAAEIRTGCPDGHTLRVRTTSAGVVSEATHRFDDGDADGVTISHLSDTGSHSARVAWLDLQAHASFPEDRTTISTEVITTEIGELDCLRYDVEGEPAMTFWFALAHPGMPVRYTDGRSVTEVVGVERA